MSTTIVSRWIAAPPGAGFAALLHPSLIPQRRVQDGVAAADNVLGREQALATLARLVELR